MKEAILNNIITSFKDTKVLIVGDVMIDQYLTGEVNRISPEAPIQILDHKESTQRLGGAANVALNIKALGATPLLLSIVGTDESGKDFRSLLKDQDITSKYILEHPTKRTTRKTRIMSGHQHLLRVDFEDKTYIDKAFGQTILEEFKAIIQGEKPEVIIFQDYNKGLMTPLLINEMTTIANNNNIPTAVDPKFTNFFAYKNVTLFKPNLKELSEGLNIPLSSNNKELINADKKLREVLNHKISFFTLSENGIFASSQTENHLKPTKPRTISDVCGAGDAVISIIALCLAKSIDLETMIDFANTAGGQVCEIAGVAPLNINKIKLEILD